MCGAVSAWVWWRARDACFVPCNAGADVVPAHMWCIATLGEARRDYFSQCNAGAQAIE